MTPLHSVDYSGDVPMQPPNQAQGQLPREMTPVGWRELVALLALVVICDVVIYRGYGFAGFALLFAATPMLFAFGVYRPQHSGYVWLVGFMMLAAAGKLLWCGSELLVGCGFSLLVTFAMVVSGQIPYVGEVVVFGSQSILAGFEGLGHYVRSISRTPSPAMRVPWLSFLLPLIIGTIFSALFVLANPDLLASVSVQLEKFSEMLRAWIVELAPHPTELIFWCAMIWVFVGLLRPIVRSSSSTSDDSTVGVRPVSQTSREQTGAYAAYAPYRNTLIAVIVLFAVYLVFEFKTLWFRVFEEGFYYSGYAHNGAAWLTVALALATLLLSLIFQRRVLADPRIGTLRRLAWLWSLQNFV
ncbi:MAG: hypothetical protein ACI9HK_005580, partial [Pirellulaceae bacterium]